MFMPSASTHAYGLYLQSCYTLQLADLRLRSAAGGGVNVRVEPETFRFNGVYRLIYYYCGCSSDYGGVVAMEVS
eukprot:jgi/Chrzof1/9490/Cz04g05040.t1